jgi:hypothetical protein
MFEDTMTEMKQIIENSRKMGQAALTKGFNDIFNLHPEIKAIAWCQYTPYFNDGEACEFGIHDIYYTTEAIVPDDVEYYDLDGEWKYAPYGKPKDTVPDYEKTLHKLSKFMHSDAMENVMRSVFGDDSFIVAGRDGFHIYDFSDKHE